MKIQKINDDYLFWCPACKCGHMVNDKIWRINSGEVTITPSVLSNVKGINPNKPICHIFVTKGKIQYLNDCTHNMAGKTIEMEDAEKIWTDTE